MSGCVTTWPWVLCLPLTLVGCFSEAPPVGADVPTSGDTGGSAAGTSASDASSGGVRDATSGEPSAETTYAGSTGSDSDDGSEGGDSSTGSVARPAFFDPFDRDDDAALGRDWIEKVATTWGIYGGRLAAEVEPGPFSFWQDHLWHRPPEDDAADLVVSVEFTITSPHPDNHPMLIARVQPEALEDRGSFVGYSLYASDSPGIEDSSQITLQRTNGEIYEQWPSTTFARGFVPFERYQLRLAVHGELPVELHGALYQYVQDAWVLVGDVSHSDGASERIWMAGSWGGGGGVTEAETHNYVFDNYGAEFGPHDAFIR